MKFKLCSLCAHGKFLERSGAVEEVARGSRAPAKMPFLVVPPGTLATTITITITIITIDRNDRKGNQTAYE